MPVYPLSGRGGPGFGQFSQRPQRVVFEAPAVGVVVKDIQQVQPGTGQPGIQVAHVHPADAAGKIDVLLPLHVPHQGPFGLFDITFEGAGITG